MAQVQWPALFNRPLMETYSNKILLPLTLNSQTVNGSTHSSAVLFDEQLGNYTIVIIEFCYKVISFTIYYTDWIQNDKRGPCFNS